MFEPRLPFEEDIEHVKADTAEEVRLKADTTEQVCLKADTTEMDEAVGVRRPHEKNIGTVRLPPSREATADRRSLGGGGQGCLYSRGFVARQTLDVFRRRFVRAHAFIDVRGDCLEVEARGAKKISSTR